MNKAVATSELGERRDMPQTPWPLVHPEPSHALVSAMPDARAARPLTPANQAPKRNSHSHILQQQRFVPRALSEAKMHPKPFTIADGLVLRLESSKADIKIDHWKDNQ
jgi:hypothetical protein